MLELGDTEQAGTLLDPVTAADPQPDGWFPHIYRAEVDLRRGLAEPAARRLDAVRRLPIGDVRCVCAIVQRAMEVALWQRLTEPALAAVERTLATLSGGDEELFCGELFVQGGRAVADLAERSRARGDRPGEDTARAAADRLAAALDRTGGRPFADHPYLARIPADRATWAAEAGRASGANDAFAWEMAAVEWRKLGSQHRAAYAWWRCAEARLAGSGRPPDALPALQAAAAAADGMAPLLAAIRRLARRARIPLDAPADAGPAAPAAPAPYVLTEREQQVLRLLTHGRTNAQVGTELYISPKTAGVHVMNILRKLDVSNRTHAAAKAERAGLFDDPDPV
jgi:DNA-binding CsgD family transcriptional regulator